jgi:hypothetical protein
MRPCWTRCDKHILFLGFLMWRKYLLGIGVALLAVIIAAEIKAMVFDFKIRKPHDPQPSLSAAIAKAKGVWICGVSIEPSIFKLNQREYLLGKAWIEEVVEDDCCFYLFPCQKKLGFNRLVFRVPHYPDGFFELRGTHHDAISIWYDGGDFVAELQLGEYPQIECNVAFRFWHPEKTVELGKVKLTPK